MIYLDHNATTPIHAAVVEAMQPYLTSFYGNPSSLHKLGRLSRGAIDRARVQIAALVGASPQHIVFTSGGTEANNLAIQGFAGVHPAATIAYGATEHPSVSAPADTVKRRGHPVYPLAVDGDGQIRLDALPAFPDNSASLASIMLANNETGVIQDLAVVREAFRNYPIVLHSDAVQAAGKIPLDFVGLGLQMMSISGHKIGAPKGIGALVVDPEIELESLVQGGGQEQGLRGGTENVAAIVGFGKAAELALTELDNHARHVRTLRLKLEQQLAAMSGVTIFGDPRRKLPNTLQFALEGVDGEMLVMRLDQANIAASSGSACKSGGGEPSPVLTAMGVPPDLAKSAVRISLGPSNTAADIDALIAALHRIRASQGALA